MTTRRRFIQTLAAIPPALSFRRVWAAPDPSRLALIIGNSSYHDAPLVNPVNDAKAVAGLFTQAGFSVDSRLNATRVDMMAAIERFGTAIKRAETKLVVFYYAGHGAQLDWRNYLLPIDAVVQRQEDMKERCVDLSLLLGQLSAAKDKTFIVILDACRNNPFGKSYRPEQKGLSQFDAPVGSLLAYATSPGNVASDGDGQNGLYTENLVRELSVRNTRIEDALKRVRLNVRLASHGEQIPWETTSLEGDVFIFNEGQKKLSEAELEKLVEADVTEWARIKSSKKVDDWVSYLRSFPNGRFAEIAQMRLTRLLADVEKQRVEREQQEKAKAEALAAEKRQEEQKRLDQERAERERIRLAEAQRLAAERKQLEEQQLQEQRRREEEQKAIEAKRRQEQERLDRERQRIAEAERQAAERRKQEEQRQVAERDRIERERQRAAEAQRLAAERRQLEEQQRQEQRRRQDEQQALELKRREEQERLDREQRRIVEAERLAEERRQLEAQRQAAEQKRLEQQKLELAATEKPAPTQAAATSQAPRPAPAAAPSGAPMIEIHAGVAVPLLIAPSTNPFSSGRYPLNRIFTVGDSATVRQTDLLTGVEERTFTARVTRVDYDEDRVEFNNGTVITDLMGNNLKAGPIEFDSPVQFIPAEFQVGKKWTAAFRRTQNGRTTNAYYDLQIVKRENVTVPAGTFDTFRIEGEGWNTTDGARLEVKFWLVPGLNFGIKREFITRNRFGRFGNTERHELVSIRQQTIQTACLPAADGPARTLAVKGGCQAPAA